MNELNLKNVGGIFLVLMVGVVVGGVMAVAEHFWERCRGKVENKNSTG